MTKRQTKSNTKPWITKGIKNSIFNRNKLYNLALRTKNPLDKNNFLTKYKHYRNKIVNLIRLSKSNHFKHFFQTNMNNAKNIWKGVRQIIKCKENSKSKISLNINNKVESDPLKIANHFNEYFTSIADQIRAEIPASEKSFETFKQC